MGMSGPSLPDHVSSAKRLARLIGLVKQLRTRTLMILVMSKKNDKRGPSRMARSVGEAFLTLSINAIGPLNYLERKAWHFGRER